MDDRAIIALFNERSELAIKACRERFGAYLRRVALNVTGSERDAEECENDAYLAAWNAIPPERPRSLRAWLARSARNSALTVLERSSAQKRGGGEAPVVLDEIAELVSDTDSVEQEIGRRELASAIDSFLGGLSAGKRSIFVCRYWYFDSIYAIASRFGMTENNVSVTLSRLRSKLHNYLLERGFNL